MKFIAFLFFMSASASAKIGLNNLAARCYKLSAKSFPSMADLPLYNLGNLYQESGDLENSIRSFQSATNFNPGNLDAWINLGRVLDDFGSHSTALKCYDTALRMDPYDSICWSNRGNSLRSVGKHEEAAKSYAKALEIQPGDGVAIVGRAVCLALSGDKRGVHHLNKLYEESNSSWVLLERAKILTKAGRFDRAFSDFKKLLDTDPENHLVWLHRAKLMIKLSEADEALDNYDRALAIAPNYSQTILGKAKLLAKLKRFEVAKPLLRKYYSRMTMDEKTNPNLKKLYQICGLKF